MGEEEMGLRICPKANIFSPLFQQVKGTAGGNAVREGEVEDGDRSVHQPAGRRRKSAHRESAHCESAHRESPQQIRRACSPEPAGGGGDAGAAQVQAGCPALPCPAHAPWGQRPSLHGPACLPASACLPATPPLPSRPPALPHLLLFSLTARVTAQERVPQTRGARGHGSRPAVPTMKEGRVTLSPREGRGTTHAHNGRREGDNTCPQWEKGGGQHTPTM